MSAPAARPWLRMLAVAVAVVGLDQATKLAINETVARGEEVSLALGFELVNVRNNGIAFGLLDDGGALVVVITVVTLAALLAWFASGPRRPGLWLGIGLLVGGAVGNLIDRVGGEGVTDFLDPPSWPAFNVADIAITAGVIVLVLVAFAGEDAARAQRT